MGWHPEHPRARRALDDLLDGEWPRELLELASTASVWHALYRGGVKGNAPIKARWLATFANVGVVVTVSEDEPSWDPLTRAASIPSSRSAAQIERDTFHEVAHSILYPVDDHPSVERLGALLMVDRATFAGAVQLRGAGAIVHVVRTHAQLPPWSVAASCLLWSRVTMPSYIL